MRDASLQPLMVQGNCRALRDEARGQGHCPKVTALVAQQSRGKRGLCRHVRAGALASKRVREPRRSLDVASCTVVKGNVGELLEQQGHPLWQANPQRSSCSSHDDFRRHWVIVFFRAAEHSSLCFSAPSRVISHRHVHAVLCMPVAFESQL